MPGAEISSLEAIAVTVWKSMAVRGRRECQNVEGGESRIAEVDLERVRADRRTFAGPSSRQKMHRRKKRDRPGGDPSDVEDRHRTVQAPVVGRNRKAMSTAKSELECVASVLESFKRRGHSCIVTHHRGFIVIRFHDNLIEQDRSGSRNDLKTSRERIWSVKVIVKSDR